MEVNDVKIKIKDVELSGILEVPQGAEAIILFAHGSGSSRLSPRNQFVAKVLNKAGFATLLMDLLTEEEEVVDDKTGELRFDVEFLAKRLVMATKWLRENEETKDLRVGYFGSSTGAAAALIAASKVEGIFAIVSRGGRPDLALEYLDKVSCPTLLIVGGEDSEVIGMNKEALEKLKSKKKLEIISGATHLFEEKGALEKVADIAADWFVKLGDG
ncbi:dienelactone hydrolase family protein [Candidatus Pacearchaeota archaeon]|nr:dienelactone hydrolase family protein [Candidatus Pacearchaeota archaeon]